jgi:hypothetical protein
MKKIFVLAAIAMLMTASVSYANNGDKKQDKCKKTCTKPCPKPCKEKCDKSKCAKA